MTEENKAEGGNVEGMTQSFNLTRIRRTKVENRKHMAHAETRWTHRKQSPPGFRVANAALTVINKRPDPSTARQ